MKASSLARGEEIKIDNSNFIITIPFQLEEQNYIIKIGALANKNQIMFYIFENSFLSSKCYGVQMTLNELNQKSKYFRQLDNISDVIDSLNVINNSVNKTNSEYRIYLEKSKNQNSLNIKFNLPLVTKKIETFTIECKEINYNDKQIILNFQEFIEEVKTNIPQAYKMIEDHFNQKYNKY